MKNISVLLLLAASVSAFAQKADIWTVSTVEPKSGQRKAWEAAYKTHIAKFHATTDKTNVYEIMSGPSTGSYHIGGAPGTYADFDTQRADAAQQSIFYRVSKPRMRNSASKTTSTTANFTANCRLPKGILFIK